MEDDHDEDDGCGDIVVDSDGAMEIGWWYWSFRQRCMILNFQKKDSFVKCHEFSWNWEMLKYWDFEILKYRIT